jgi:GNAT superfamily N-acetyltransferase
VIVAPWIRRPYAGADDLRQMQMTLAAAFPNTGLHVGDLAWLARDLGHMERRLRIDLWEDTVGRLAGWTFLRPNGGFNLFVDGGRASIDAIDLMLNVIDERAGEAVAAGDPPTPLYTYSFDAGRSATDRVVAEALQRRGYRAVLSPGGLLERALDHLPTPDPPPGFRLTDLSDEALVPDRVEAHRLAFAPSELTLVRYRRVRSTWPYQPALDRVAVDERGIVAAFCTAWCDDINGCGLLEPVGTVPLHQRRGLARAVCLDALHALRAAGMTRARVGFDSAPAEALYRSLGFSDFRADVRYRRGPA